MIRQLFIYLGPAAPAEVQWAVSNGSGRLRSGRGPLAEVPRSAGDRLVVLVPGADVLVTEVAIPGGRKRLLRQSLPFLLEENLADEVEEIHFAGGPAGAAGKLAVAAVSRARLAGWLAMLSETGLQAAVLTPATLAVPVTGGNWTLVLTDDGFLARQGEWRVFAGELENINLYLRPETSLAAAETAPVVEVLNCTGQELDLQLDGLKPGAHRPAQLMKVLAEGFATQPSINLLQGEFAGNARWRETFRRWQVALVAAAALLLLTSVDATLDYLRLRGESTRLNREIITTFQQALPDSRRVVNARAQMEQRLKELRGSDRQNSFFTLYDKAAPLLAATGSPGLEFIRFHQGRLELDLDLASLEILENLKNNLAKAPEIISEIRNVESSGGRVRARLSLEVKS